MQPVVTAEQMRALDRTTIEELGMPAIVLMETAGRAVAAAALAMLQGRAGHVAVVCGPGNNGGDGFVAARVLAERGVDTAVYLAADVSQLRGDARSHFALFQRCGGRVVAVDGATGFAAARPAIAGAALVIDALFGVGLARPIEGHLAQVVAAINDGARRLAVDIPSGLDADTGRPLGAVVTADRTATMVALKVALVSAPGFARCGQVEVAEIGIPRLLVSKAANAGVLEDNDIRGALPRPSALDHKGRRGHAVVIGGMPGMRGAGRLAAIAALRAGAGLVTLASDSDQALTEPTDSAGSHRSVVDAADSVMTRSIVAPISGSWAGKQAIVIGPGLGTSELAAGWVDAVLDSGIPAVLDADALNLLAGKLDRLARAAGPRVITPHPGEAARLLATTVAAIEADRLAAARQLATATRAVVVLKGARTIVCDGGAGDGYCAINPTGGPSLATAGSGDVLAGAIGGLLAQGLSAVNAARAGTFLHGRAGEALAVGFGDRGVISSDLPAAFAAAVHALA